MKYARRTVHVEKYTYILTEYTKDREGQMKVHHLKNTRTIRTYVGTVTIFDESGGRSRPNLRT